MQTATSMLAAKLKSLVTNETKSRSDASEELVDPTTTQSKGWLGWLGSPRTGAEPDNKFAFKPEKGMFSVAGSGLIMIAGVSGSGKSVLPSMLALQQLQQKTRLDSLASQQVMLDDLNKRRHFSICLAGEHFCRPQLIRHMAAGLTGLRVVLKAASGPLNGWLDAGLHGSFYPDEEDKPDYFASLAEALTGDRSGVFLLEWDPGATAIEFENVVLFLANALEELLADGRDLPVHVLLEMSAPSPAWGFAVLMLREQLFAQPNISFHLFADEINDLLQGASCSVTRFISCEGAQLKDLRLVEGMPADLDAVMRADLSFGCFHYFRRQVDSSFGAPQLLKAEWLDESEDHWAKPLLDADIHSAV